MQTVVVYFFYIAFALSARKAFLKSYIFAMVTALKDVRCRLMIK